MSQIEGSFSCLCDAIGNAFGIISCHYYFKRAPSTPVKEETSLRNSKVELFSIRS